MKAVIAQMWPDVLAERKRIGADQWDEVWDGVLHMPPAPNYDHQDFEFELESWLKTHWAKPRGGLVNHQINVAPVGGWPNKNYRIPDLVLLAPDRLHINRNAYYEGAPTVVVEIHSPDDESYEKLPFYADLGVPEVWIIDRDTRRGELYVLVEGEYAEQEAGPGGWLTSAATDVEFHGTANSKLAIRIAGDKETLRELP